MRCDRPAVRIAISGTHSAGKSTLLEALSGALPKYAIVEEPYHVMVEDGYEFADPPELEDFEAQIEHAIESLSDAGANTLFDRSPADFVAYIEALEHAEAFDREDWLARVSEAMQTLDLVVFVPIEAGDRTARRNSDHDPALRGKVDKRLREIWVDDALGFGVEVIEVKGSIAQRAQTVIAHMRRAAT